MGRLVGNSGVFFAFVWERHSIDRFCSIEQQVRCRAGGHTAHGTSSCAYLPRCMLRSHRSRSLLPASARRARLADVRCCCLVVVCVFAAAVMRVTFVTLAILVAAVCVAATDLRVEGEAPGTMTHQQKQCNASNATCSHDATMQMHSRWRSNNNDRRRSSNTQQQRRCEREERERIGERNQQSASAGRAMQFFRGRFDWHDHAAEFDGAATTTSIFFERRRRSIARAYAGSRSSLLVLLACLLFLFV